MGNISIVTAFFDIGRETWTQDKGLPHYLYRPLQTYFDRFSIMAELDNEMVIFTTKDLVDKVWEYRKGKEDKTIVAEVDYADEFKELRLAIASIQSNPDYQKLISPLQRKNPEYWSADYVLVNTLKAHFVNRAINNKFSTNELVAWVDFGYCRNKEEFIKGTEWNYDFDTDKMTLFRLKEFDIKNDTILNLIVNNDVHMTGGAIVGGKTVWPTFDALIQHSFSELHKNNLVDDDQTLLLMASLLKPELFKIYDVTHGEDWLRHNSVFNKYNK
jgi:protein YibB